MIAEENLSIGETHKISISNFTIILLVNSLMKKTVPYFKSYLASDFYKKRNLNEDNFTQIFIEQAQILIRKQDCPFNIGGQLRDITNLSKGFSDVYFYPNEQDISTESIFSVESKRLPSPTKTREREYVIGEKNNGGLERYKTEIHGKGLNECGMLGFIEKETSTYWLTTINGFIEDLSKSDKTWNKDEILTENENASDYCYLRSVVHRITSQDIFLHHLWIIISKV